MSSSVRKWYQIIAWWEIRRLLYNGILLAVISCIFYFGDGDIPFIYGIIFLVLNGLYTLIWVGDLSMHFFPGSRASNIKEATTGFVFYLVLSLLLLGSLSMWIVI